jgi:hypothetical protein
MAAKKKIRRWKKSEVLRMFALRLKGWSWKQIGAALGTNGGHAYNLVRRHGHV